ncbi:MAG: cation transporter [Coriobacteriales bacterium]|nr:cation transporter [Coriobacteriales bacterium]
MSITTIVKVGGMSCDHCVKAVTEALEELADVIKVEVNLKKQQAQVESLSALDANLVSAAIDEAGYDFEGLI